MYWQRNERHNSWGVVQQPRAAKLARRQIDTSIAPEFCLNGAQCILCNVRSVTVNTPFMIVAAANA